MLGWIQNVWNWLFYQNFSVFFVFDFEDDPESSSSEFFVNFVLAFENGTFL